MSWTQLSSKRGVRARKRHTCYYCGEPILVGEKYDIWVGTYPGEGIITTRAHPECLDAVAGWEAGDHETFDPGSLARGKNKEKW